jgi:hypothetical protein
LNAPTDIGTSPSNQPANPGVNRDGASFCAADVDVRQF